MRIEPISSAAGRAMNRSRGHTHNAQDRTQSVGPKTGQGQHEDRLQPVLSAALSSRKTPHRATLAVAARAYPSARVDWSSFSRR